MSRASSKIVVIAVSAVSLVASGTALAAQGGVGRGEDGFRLGVSLGTTFPTGYAVSMPGDIGLHAQLSGLWRSSRRVIVRADVFAGMLSGAAAEPSCVPGAPCRGYALHPDQVYSGTMSAELRPFPSVSRLFATAGGGVYYGRGPEATSFGTTVGLLGGVGVDLSRAGHGGFAIEGRYHWLANRFGTLRAMLTPAISYRF